MKRFIEKEIIYENRLCRNSDISEWIMEGKGLVIKSAGSTYTVRSSDSHSIECKLVGKYRLEELRSTNPVVVGDWVEFTPKHIK